MMTQSRCYYHS